MTKTIHACLILLCVLPAPRVEAQSTPAGSSAAASSEQKPPADPLGRSTPHGTVTGLIRVAEQGNLDGAAEYLDPGLRLPARRELARQLWTVLDRKLLTGLGRLSDQPDGNLEDGQATRDRIGVIDSPSGDVELFLDRVPRGKSDPIWLFSAEALQEIPRLYDELEPPWIERHIPERLRAVRVLSLPLYRWIAFALSIPLIFGLAALSTRALRVLLSPLLRRLTRGQGERTLVSLGPLRLLVLALFCYFFSFFGLSLVTRSFWQRVAQTLLVIAVCWLSLRLSDLLADLSLARLERKQRSADTALVRLLNRLLKAAISIVAVLMLLYLLDADLTAALTGLGVGGIAIGFGAQKTIENLFGGIMVISDKPINIGDVCRAGEFFGTVEDIGIRSTRIRTPNRTVVSVPNGLLAAMSLENFAQRDRMPFQHTVSLKRQLTTDELRVVLEQIRALLAAHPKVDADSARARFVRITNISLDVEIFAYVLEREQTAFLAIQEDLLLGVMDIIGSGDTSLAAPMIVQPAPSPAGR
jgi:MscS family membrane protein